MADALSRIEVAPVTRPSCPTHEEIATAQAQNDELKAYREKTDSSLQLRDLPILASALKVTCDLSTGIPRPFVRGVYRRRMYDVIHGFSHPGVKPTIKLLIERYIRGA